MDDPKQTYIDKDLAPPSIPELDAAGAIYRKVRDERMRTAERERELRAELLDLMRKHEQTNYRFSDQIIMVVEGEDKVSVKTVKDDA